MRSACCGARSVRSLMTIWPLLVSITIVFSGSTPAGSLGGAASAGAAQTSAAMSAKTRIIKAPLPSWVMSGAGFAGALGLEPGRDRGRHEARDVAAQAGDLTHQSGGDRADRRRGRQKHGLDLRRHGAVHAGHLHLVIEVGAVAQAA